ncbi:hypothetical protein HDU91_001725, partial [Kappamyces sp. JEL0680]
GMNRQGLLEHGQLLDGINIMAYDAGSSYDALAAFDAYRSIYPAGWISLGFQVGAQGWGGHLLGEQELHNGLVHVKKDGHAGIFVWAWQKDHSGTMSCAEILLCASRVL